MKTLQSLQAISAYPIPEAAIRNIAEESGIGIDAELTSECRAGAAYKRAKANVYIYLMTAPSVTQNGISYSFSSEERQRFRTLARRLLAEIGDDTAALGQGPARYGYIGEDF